MSIIFSLSLSSLSVHKWNCLAYSYECYRALRKFSGKDSLVAKLVSLFGMSLDIYFILILNPLFAQFAKHMKVEEQVTLLKNKKIGVGVGTPARLMELIDNGEFFLIRSAHFSVRARCLRTNSSLFQKRYADINDFGQVRCRWTSCSAWSSMPRTLTKRRGVSWT